MYEERTHKEWAGTVEDQWTRVSELIDVFIKASDELPEIVDDLSDEVDVLRHEFHNMPDVPDPDECYDRGYEEGYEVGSREGVADVLTHSTRCQSTCR